MRRRCAQPSLFRRQAAGASAGHDGNGGSILTLMYYGGENVVAHYNVMGVAEVALKTSARYLAHALGPENIRVNATSQADPDAGGAGSAISITSSSGTS